MRHKKNLIIFLLCFCISASYGEIYQSIDADGVVTYSDQPSTQSKPVALEKQSVASSPPAPVAITQKTGQSAANINTEESYKVFEISSPKNQDTFQNATDLTVTVNVQPKLKKGDKIQYFLDGQAASDPITETSYTIPKVSGTKEILMRGQHTLSASLLNDKGEVIKTTSSITVYLHYTSILFPPAQNN